MKSKKKKKEGKKMLWERKLEKEDKWKRKYNVWKEKENRKVL